MGNQKPPYEEGLAPPTRHPIDWQNPDFYDAQSLDEELRRVFDICHGCRRCFNLCDSFPRLFDLIDAAPSGELDTVQSEDFSSVVDACTLCDMCYMTKCPYVPPHSFNVDFPHLMLRYRAQEHSAGHTGWVQKQIAQTDRNGRMGTHLAPIANALTSTHNPVTRRLIESAIGIHREAALPKFAGRTLCSQLKKASHPINPQGPGSGTKVVLFATCYGNYNSPHIGLAAQAVLAHNGVEVVAMHPGCCGMPQLEQGDLKNVVKRAEATASTLEPWIDKGYTIVTLVPSCALMLKQEWPLLLPDHQKVQKLKAATQDVTEFVLGLSRQSGGLSPGLQPLDRKIIAHVACHARAQNLGPTGAEILKLIPEADVSIVERCSGHGGSWGIMKDHFPIAMKMAQPVIKAISKQAENLPAALVSECPLAASHLEQSLALADPEGRSSIQHAGHPIELIAQSYGFHFKDSSS